MPDNDDHIEELLPWYVNGTLSEEDLQEVNKAIKSDSHVGVLIDEEIEISHLFNDPIEQTSQILTQQQAAFSVLQQSIQHEKNQPKNNIFPFNKQIISYAAAASILIATGSIVWNWQTEAPNDEFRVLTNSSDTDLMTIQVIFKDEVENDVIDELFRHNHVTVISGPSVNGLYRIGVDNETDFTFWENHPDVRWAQSEVR